MNINELCDTLKQDYEEGESCGVVKLPDAGWENIYFVVPPRPPLKLELKDLPIKSLNEANKILGKLPSYEEMTELDKLINFLFVRREVVQSSRLEGTWSTIDHALTPGEIVDEKKGQDEHKAVRSYAHVLEDIIHETLDKKENVFSENFICNIHKKIIENDPNSKGVSGKLRTPGEPGSIVTIGGGQRRELSIYNPAPAREVKRCLNEVIEWLRNSELATLGELKGDMCLPVRLAVGHSHFEAVHPFTDGNGRAGRALWPIQMVCNGHMPLYLSGYVEAYKEEYSRGLEEAQKKLNYRPLIEFICNAIIESSIEAIRTKEVISGLEDIWQKRGRFRDKSSARRTLSLLLTAPIITSQYLEKKLNIKKTAADDAIKKLVEKKIIRYRHVENRHRVYAAEELIQILSRPFGSDIDLALEKGQRLLESLNDQ